MGRPDAKFTISAKDKSGKAIKGVKGNLKQLGATAIKQGALIGVAMAAGIGIMVKQQLAAIDTTAKLSDNLNIQTEDLIAYRLAAELAGVESATFDKALEQLIRRLGEAAGGTGLAKQQLDDLNLSAKELIQLDTGAAFRIIADEISKLPTQAERADAAYQLFGRSGVQLVKILELGSKGLIAQRREAEALGLTFSRVDAKRVEDANDAILVAQRSITGLAQRLTIELAPSFTFVAEEITETIKRNDSFKEEVVEGARQVASAIAFIGDGFRGLAIAIKLVDIANKELVLAQQTGFGIIDQSARNLVNTFGDVADSQSDLLTKAILTGVAIGQLREEVQKLSDEPLPSEKVESFFAKLKLGAEDANDEIKETREEIKKLAESSTDVSRPTVVEPSRGKTEAELAIDEMREVARVRTQFQQDLANDQARRRAEEQAAGQEAADTIKSTLGSEVFNVLDENNQNIGDSFLDLFKRMASDAIASGFISILGGAEGGIFQSLGSLFGVGKATGGPVAAGQLVRVNEFGTEGFQPNTGGRIVPLSAGGGGGTTLNNTQVFQFGSAPSESIRRSAAEVGMRAARGVGAALRRNG